MFISFTFPFFNVENIFDIHTFILVWNTVATKSFWFFLMFLTDFIYVDLQQSV